MLLKVVKQHCRWPPVCRGVYQYHSEGKEDKQDEWEWGGVYQHLVSENSPDESHRWGGGALLEEGFNIPVRLGFIVWIPEACH